VASTSRLASAMRLASTSRLASVSCHHFHLKLSKSSLRLGCGILNMGKGGSREKQGASERGNGGSAMRGRGTREKLVGRERWEDDMRESQEARSGGE